MRISFAWLFSILVVMIISSACQGSGLAQAPARPVGPTLTFTPFQAVSATPRPTLTSTPTIAPTATPEPCRESQGRIEAMEQQFAGSEPLHFRVYTPPCYSENPDVPYPVLYMIHGQTYADDQWERLGIGETADRLISHGDAPPFLIVMPQEDNTYADIFISAFTRKVIEGLVPWIDEHYPTCAERACRAIGGLSRGGAWSLRLGFTHPELFSAIGLHSTPPFNTDPGLFPQWIRDIPTDQVPRVYMDIGRGDPFLSMASAFEAQLVRYDVPHEWYLNNGTHEEAYWSDHVEDYLLWYSTPWKDRFR